MRAMHQRCDLERTGPKACNSSDMKSMRIFNKADRHTRPLRPQKHTSQPSGKAMGCIGRGKGGGGNKTRVSLKGTLKKKPWPFPGPSEEGVEYATLDAAVGNEARCG